MADALRKFKGSLSELIDAIGEKAVLDLIVHFGGLELYVPHKLNPDHPLMVLGEKSATALCATFGGDYIGVPRSAVEVGAIRTCILDLRRQYPTMGRPAIARRAGCTVRYVSMVLQEQRDKAQLSLL